MAIEYEHKYLLKNKPEFVLSGNGLKIKKKYIISSNFI